jgi:hypothetical protein
MGFAELRSLMAAQIFAGLAARLPDTSTRQLQSIAKIAVEAAKAIADEVANEQWSKPGEAR